MMDSFFKRLYFWLRSLGIEPFYLLTLIMIVWVGIDIYNFKKDKSWSKSRLMVKASFILRVIGMLIFILGSIGFYNEGR